jgi:DNA topoisomerase I
MAVVVVESPAKAKTINKYLGPGYTVLASYGHVRDLPAKDGSVDPDDDFAMTWEVAAESRKHVRAIAEALKTDDTLILATDPDREGEAISWHLQEALASSLKKGKTVSRVTFNAITKAAVTEAMANPRQVDVPLVDAYLARRALDYLVGFTLSPVLWRKLPGARSAGRVQSVCLRLIVEREMEIEAFRAREYWTVGAVLATPRGQEYEARLITLAGKKLDKFDIATAEAAEIAVQAVTKRTLAVQSVESKPAARNPYAPFMTSTLQQEASRKFGMGAKVCMSAAQRLYEAGHITYMRTDGIDMAPEAVMAARAEIKDRFGAAYVPDSPRMYKNKAKNAQEAHECIRPTDMGLSPDKLRIADADQRRLYDLIWKRTIASQMAAARLERTTVDVGSADGQVGLRATGQVVLFDGFLKVYDEGRDDDGDEDGARLPQIMQGEQADKRSVTPEQHFTQPPPRYTEATLVKRMEELGIGRPSTYASIVTTIQDREYVRKDKNRLIPEDKGRLVTAFLSNFFRKYVEYDFTAALEGQLDDVSAGSRDYKEVLARFWRDFSAAVAETADLRIGEVLDKIDDFLAPHLYPARADGTDPRSCPTCGTGRLHLKTARSGGAFIGCGNYPECRYTRPISVPEDGAITADGRVLGQDAEGRDITLRAGRFGPYVQRGEATEANPKPDRASLPKGWQADTLTLERALDLLVAAARDRPASGRRPDGRGGDRPFRPLHQARPRLRQYPRCRRGLHHRHEPRGRGSGAKGRPRPARAGVGPRRVLARSGRASRWRRGGADAGQVRALRQMGKGERHPAQGHPARGGDAGTGAGTDRGKGVEGRQGQEGPRKEGGRQEGPSRISIARGQHAQRVHVRHEIGHIVRHRVGDDLARGAALHDAPAFHQRDAVADLERLVQIVADEDDGALQLGLQVQQARPATAPGSAGPAPKTARPSAGSAPRSQRRGPGPRAAACRPTTRPPCGRPIASGSPAPAAHPPGRGVRPWAPRQFQPQPHILAHRAPGQQAELLEHHRHPVLPDAAQVAAVGMGHISPAIAVATCTAPPAHTGFSPLTARSSVDLPDPDRPISTRISPSPRQRAVVHAQHLPGGLLHLGPGLALSIRGRAQLGDVAEHDRDAVEIARHSFAISFACTRSIRSSMIATTTMMNPDSNPSEVFTAVQRPHHRHAQPVGPDQRRDHHHRQRQHDGLVQPRHDLRKGGGQLHLPQPCRGVAPKAVAASSSGIGVRLIPRCVSRIGAGSTKITVAISPGTMPMPKNTMAGIR